MTRVTTTAPPTDDGAAGSGAADGASLGASSHTSPAHAASDSVPAASSLSSWVPSGSELLFVVLVLGFVFRPRLTWLADVPAVQTWSTIFVAIALQALPFLVLGTLISGAIAAFVPASFFRRALPSRTAFAVPVAGVAGVLLPGCECGSVPVAGSLMARGVTPGAALAFLLSAPAINPIVLVSTAVAFPGQPAFVLARFTASLAAAVIVGLLWMRFGDPRWIRQRPTHAHPDAGRWASFGGTVRHDMLQAGGFLVLGALLAATLNVVVPRSIYAAVAQDPVLSVVALSLLAVLLSICSEADAFVAASLAEFSSTAKLAFLVVGPMVDIKLVALQIGTFGRSFAVRFAPVTLVVAIAAAVAVSAVLL